MSENEKNPEKTLGAVRDLLINPNGPPLTRWPFWVARRAARRP